MNGTIGRCAEALGAISGSAVAATAGIQGSMLTGAIPIGAATTLLLGIAMRRPAVDGRRDDQQDRSAHVRAGESRQITVQLACN